MKKRKEKMLWGKCPYCKEVFQFPFKDRVNVILFGHWKKYHRCNKQINPSKRKPAHPAVN